MQLVLLDRLALKPSKHAQNSSGVTSTVLTTSVSARRLRESMGVSVGADVGVSVGADVGVSVGADVGVSVGADVGASVGADVGASVGTSMGVMVGSFVVEIFLTCITVLDATPKAAGTGALFRKNACCIRSSKVPRKEPPVCKYVSTVTVVYIPTSCTSTIEYATRSTLSARRRPSLGCLLSPTLG
jgi:hypothetical protein